MGGTHVVNELAQMLEALAEAVRKIVESIAQVVARLIVATVLLAVTGCGEHVSIPKTEGARVDCVGYTPPMHGDGMGVGYTTGGNMALSSVTVDAPAHYFVVYRCQHGSFVVDRTDNTLWSQIHEGDSVTVFYSEEWYVFDRGKPQETKRFERYDFLNADVVHP